MLIFTDNSKNMRKKSIIILIIALAILAGGFYVVWYVIPGAYIDNENQEPETQAPTLFGKDDYQIVEKSDGIYIVVDKVGLTAKVPEGWTIEMEGDDYPEPEYWVNLYSSDFSTTTDDVLKSGCTINVVAQTAEKMYQDLKKNMDILQEEPEKAPELLRKDYVLSEDFRLIQINKHIGLKLISSENAIIGGGKNIKIPLEKYKIISLGLGFPLEYREICYTIWEEFLENVEIE